MEDDVKLFAIKPRSIGVKHKYQHLHFKLLNNQVRYGLLRELKSVSKNHKYMSDTKMTVGKQVEVLFIGAVLNLGT